MLRTVFVVAGCITDVTLALSHAVSPESAVWLSGLSLVAAGTGSLVMARTLSKRLAGLDLPAVRNR